MNPLNNINSELIIDSNVIVDNILYIKRRLKKSANFMAIIKSDAYGHIIEDVVKDIDEIVDGYGVVRIEEALKVRKQSNKKILLMQGIYSQADYQIARDNNFDLAVHNNDQFKIIIENKNFENLWLKVNTGMNRLGFEVNEFLEIYEKYLYDKKFVLMSHLAASNDLENPSNHKQISLFRILSNKMHSNVEMSIANTGCIMNFPDDTYDWVRCGIGIYGGYFKDNKIKTAMTLRSPIVNLRHLKKGDKVGYDGRAEALGDMVIATVYMGYADGLPLQIKDGSEVMINGQKANVFGRVSMDLTTIDVTNINDISLGDWCEFFSTNLPVSNIAKSNELISYYFMTSIKPRVKKVYKRTS